MVRAVILPSQLPKSKMSSWSDMLSCHVHFLKYNVVMVNSIILQSQDSEIMKSSRWEMLSCQVNIYCENVAIFVILCRHVMKIIWLSRQVEWHLYASIGARLVVDLPPSATHRPTTIMVQRLCMLTLEGEFCTICILSTLVLQRQNTYEGFISQFLLRRGICRSTCDPVLHILHAL